MSKITIFVPLLMNRAKRFLNDINMLTSYELYRLNECHRLDFAAKAADSYEYSYLSATKLQNSIYSNSYNS